MHESLRSGSPSAAVALVLLLAGCGGISAPGEQPLSPARTSFGPSAMPKAVSVWVAERNGRCSGEIEASAGTFTVRTPKGWMHVRRAALLIEGPSESPVLTLDGKPVTGTVVPLAYGRTAVTLIDDPYRKPHKAPHDPADLFLLFSRQSAPGPSRCGLVPASHGVVIEARMRGDSADKFMTVEDCVQNTDPPPPDPLTVAAARPAAWAFRFGLGKGQVGSHEESVGKFAVQVEGDEFAVAADPCEYTLAARHPYLIRIDGIASANPQARLQELVSNQWVDVRIGYRGQDHVVQPRIVRRMTTGYETANLTAFVDESCDLLVEALLCDWKATPPERFNGCLFRFRRR